MVESALPEAGHTGAANDQVVEIALEALLAGLSPLAESNG